MNHSQTDLVSGTWDIKSPIPHDRSHCPPASYKNKVYVFGGGGPQFASLNSVYAYDPMNNQWERKADMPTLRSGSVTALIGDRIYVMGGGFKQANGQF